MMAVDAVVERATGVLMSQRGYDADEAAKLLVSMAERQGRATEDVARELLIGPRSATSSPVRLSQSYQEIGEAIHVLPGDLALRRVTEIAVERVAGAAWASLTLYHRDQLTTVAATDDRASAADQIQYGLTEGPCVSAVDLASAYLTNDLHHEERWPAFAERARRELGVRSLLGLRLGLDVDDLDDTIASLNIYSTAVDTFSEEAIVVATLVAAHASTAVIASQYQHRVERLEWALETNREIGMAMGVLMNEHKVTQDRAFALLRIASQHTNRKLRQVATEVVQTGMLHLPRS